MNPRVQDFIDKKKEEELKRRKDHLISIGLVEPVVRDLYSRTILL